MDQEKKYVLVLGGSNFMGKELLMRLSHMSEFEVHYINRGKTYWNNEIKLVPNLHYTYGNRNENKDFTKLLIYLSKKLGITAESGKKWEIVVDFCAFRRKNVKSVYNALAGLLKLYVFISTDSVYDVCDVKVRNLPRIIEEFAVRPKDPTLREKLKKDEDYGHNKLKCEEFLYSIEDKTQFPFIALRLPDVIGPYDDTGRFWAYVLWIKYHNDKPIEMEEEDVKHKMSFVYSCDVADLIVDLCLKSSYNDLKPEVLNQSYNLAFEEAVNLPVFLSKISQALGIDANCQIKDETNNTFYPSVECGPLETQKAKMLLGWDTTPFDDAIRETTNFFVQAEKIYPKEYREALKKLPKSLRSSDDKN